MPFPTMPRVPTFDISANATGDGVSITVIADYIAVGTIISVGGAGGGSS
jgi:hypothetical protein